MASVAKWGNSLAIRIPREAAYQLAIGEGSQVDLIVENGVLTIHPVTRQMTFDLEALLAGITEDNLHAETATGMALGNEF